nr:hypothetical protein GCM10020093_065120 [Planobispora longispora]
MANGAVLQTVPRTVNTGLGALFILAALAVLGGSSLTDFAVALLLGIVVGTFSSAFVAAPLAIVFEKRNPARRRGPSRSASRALARAPGPWSDLLLGTCRHIHICRHVPPVHGDDLPLGCVRRPPTRRPRRAIRPAHPGALRV